MNAQVSVITPFYNSKNYIRECIDSVMAQSYPYWELILVDDGSKDNTISVVEAYMQKDPRIKATGLENNEGAGMARNKGIELAKGRYIAFLDSDDTWHPEKLERQLRFMQKHQYPFTYTAYYKLDLKGRRKKVAALPAVSYSRALYKNPIGCLTVIYDTSFFGKQYMPVVRKRQDFGLWLRLLKITEARGLNEYLASYRSRSSSISFYKLELLKHEWNLYRKVEKLSFFKSVFYLFSAVFLKLKSYF
ncbi:MAG: glycosyltransferase family 2 protein [Flavobacteriaceae bacterium]